MSTVKSLALSLTIAFLCSTRASAGIIMCLEDPYDKGEVINDIREDPRVVQFHDDLELLKKKLQRLKPRDMEALFGKPVAKPDKAYAFPAAERRVIALSGLRHVDDKRNKDHVDFHVIGDHAALEAYYGIDGETISIIIVYFKPDKLFTALEDSTRLVQRLGWDRDKLQKLVRHYELQRAKAFVWEIDEAKAAKQFQGADDTDFARKIDGWIQWGKKEGLKLEYQPATEMSNQRWNWRDANGKLVAAAFHDRGHRGAEAKPTQFTRYHSNGNPAREEFGTNHLESMRWQTPDGKNIRYDTGFMMERRWQGHTWTWWNYADKTIHVELDDNNDGIPDWVKTGPIDKDYKELKPERLSVERSWAIHPDLIPNECRVPEQESRRVLIRKIVTE